MILGETENERRNNVESSPNRQIYIIVLVHGSGQVTDSAHRL